MEDDLKKQREDVINGPAERLENKKLKVSICVTCCGFGLDYHGNGFPLICPRTELPCLAIKSENIDNAQKFKELVLQLGSSGRIPVAHECIDQSFVDKMKKTFNELTSNEKTE